MASYDVGTGLSGAASGATVGGSIGGPYGAVTGGLAGLATGFLGKKKKYDDSWLRGMIAQRQGEIAEFSANLASARRRLLDRIGLVQTSTFNRFVPELESMFAGRGLQVTGGAFQSELAKRATEAEENLALTGTQLERDDLMAVENARAALFGGSIGPMGSSAQFGYTAAQQPDPLASGLGSFAGAQLGEMLTEARTRRSNRLLGRSPVRVSGDSWSGYDMGGYGVIR